ncbi:MAG: DUF2905 domain-containing protein [Calditrichaeota bacterium]|nr:DUF2905 domain-containing protein [Calditrichota bacterium]
MEDFSFQPLGKLLILVGAVTLLIGVTLLFLDKIPYIGRLPGDIIIRKKNFTFYFPITTLILLNLLLLLISWLFRK